ncbi:chaplin [Streptomyces ziwulingensis]
MPRAAKSLVMTSVVAVTVTGATGIATARDAGTRAVAADSGGGLSGNTLQAPVHVPANVCGNTINVIGLLNPAFGNECGNG